MKTKLKKHLSLFMVICICFSLIGCGNKTNEPSKNTEETGDVQSDTPSADNQKGEEKTLEFWVSWSPGEDTEAGSLKAIEDFEAKTGYKVNWTVYTYDMLHDKIISAAAAKNTPDLIWGLPEWVGEFYNMGILEDLTPYYEKWEEKSSIYPSVIEAMTVGDQIVGVPYEMTLRAFLGHENINKKAKIEMPKTWDEVLKLTDYKNKTNVYPYGIAGTGVRSPQELLVYLAQYDLELCTLQEDGKYKNTWTDNPEELKKATKVFQFYKDLVDKEVVDPASVNWGWEETDENFATGLTGMYVSGNWLAEREASNPDTMNDVTVAPIPYPSDGKAATYMEAKPLFIFNTSKHKQEAFELATAVCSKDWQQAAFADRSPREDVFTETKWSKDFSALADTGVVFPPVTLGGITQAMIDSLGLVLQNGETPEAAAKWLSEAINTSLADSGELSQ